VIAAEDTRVTAKILSAFSFKTPLIRADEHSLSRILEKLLERIANGESVAYVTDAGTPVISDPGAEFVDRAFARGLKVEVIPGASAVTAALSISGFFAQRFVFFGYLPRSAGGVRQELNPYIESTYTLVFFEAPSRVHKTLKTAYETLGERRVAICRELTKAHEEVIRGNLSDLARCLRELRGEITVVIEGKRRCL